MSKEVKSLTTVQRLDAMSRIARNLEGLSKNVVANFTNDADKGDCVLFIYGYELQGFQAFNGTDFVDMADTKYAITVACPFRELNDYGIVVTALSKGIEEKLQQALVKKIGKDLLKRLQGVDLMPLTRKRRTKK